MPKRKGPPEGPKYYLPGEEFIAAWVAALKDNVKITMEEFIDYLKPKFDYLESKTHSKADGKKSWRNVDAVQAWEAEGKGHPLTAYKVRTRCATLNKVISDEVKCPQFEGRKLRVPKSSGVQKKTIATIVTDDDVAEDIMGFLV